MGRLSVEYILLLSAYGTGTLVAAADTTVADYPGDNRCRCYQPPQAGPGVTKLALPTTHPGAALASLVTPGPACGG